MISSLVCRCLIGMSLGSILRKEGEKEAELGEIKDGRI